MKDATEIVIILDRSGSMEPIAETTVESINGFIAEHKTLTKECYLTLNLFNHDFETVVERQSMKDVKPLTMSKYKPSGTTALLDAIGKSVTDLGEHLKSLPEDIRPNQVLIVIMTDGRENSSKNYTNGTIAEMIQLQKEQYFWNFLFLGANIDSVGVAKGIGIGAQCVQDYAHTGDGIRGATRSVSHMSQSYVEEGDLPAFDKN